MVTPQRRVNYLIMVIVGLVIAIFVGLYIRDEMRSPKELYEICVHDRQCPEGGTLPGAKQVCQQQTSYTPSYSP